MTRITGITAFKRSTRALVAWGTILFASTSNSEPLPEPGSEEVHGNEVIVMVGRPRAEGSEDLRGPESEHADAQNGLDRSAFTTLVRVRELEGETRSVGEVLSHTVGVTARSLGGLGAFSSISVRGADPSHTSVSVDGIELSRIVSVTANVGQFDIGSFETLELYRGGVPPHLGGAGVGGAVNMQTALGRGADGKSLHVSLGAGSFGARHLRARWLGGERGGNSAAQFSVGYSGAAGDFSFYDNRNTRLVADDDRISVRENNSYERIELVGRARQGAWTFGSRSSVQNQGLPGATSNPAQVASLSTAHQLFDSRLDRPDLFGKASNFNLRGFASLERQHYSDPESEIGLLAQDSVYLTTSLGSGLGVHLPLAAHHEILFDLSGRLDWFADTPGKRAESGAQRTAAGNRQGGQLSLSEQSTWFEERLTFDLGIRGDLLRTVPSRDVLSEAAGPSEASQHDWFLSPRASVRYRIAESVAVKGSAGRYLRIPTLVEMFGDRGFILGNPELLPEVGTTGDLGVVWAPWQKHGPIDRVYVEAAGFASKPENPIVFLTGSGFVSQARNLDGAQIFGTELVLSMRLWKMLSLTGNYSFLDARKKSKDLSDGKLLPGRPQHRFYGRVDSAFSPGGRLLVLWSDITNLSGNFLDELNTLELPQRTLWGAGVKVAAFQSLLVSIEVKNLLNVRSELVDLTPAPSPQLSNTRLPLSDVHGFPLPGRALYLQLHWSH